jgi:serine/threonine protein phosphatase 1
MFRLRKSLLMRTFAIGDIHGCSTALKTLLDTVQPGKDDVLVTLGDYVDRGPDSKGVLDSLIELEDVTQLKPLLGNHEILLLDILSEQLDLTPWQQVGGNETLASYQADPTNIGRLFPAAHRDFLEQRCLRYWENDSHIFVHANVNAMLPMAEQTDDWLFWTRFENSYPHVSGKTMICGHTAQKNGQPAVMPKAVCIDTWACGQGWLTCLDVGAGKFYQADQSGRVRQFTLTDTPTSSLVC